jgi:hypothetical protein
MQKIKFITTIAVLGLLAFGAGNLRAQRADLETVTVKFTLTIPGATTVKGDVTKHAVDNIKVTTKDILNLIADNYDTNFPSGAQLVAVNWGFFFSVYNGDPNNGGTDLLNVGSDLIAASYKNDIAKTINNWSTGSETYNTTYIMYLSFDDNDFNDNQDKFDFYGLSHWKFSINGKNGKFSESFTAEGPVEGSISGNHFVGSGTLTGKGKGTVPE